MRRANCTKYGDNNNDDILDDDDIGVNPGGSWRVATPRFWAGVVGSQGFVRRSWTGLGKHYSLFCEESTLESVFFIRKREKLAKNIGVKGENLNILGETTIF